MRSHAALWAPNCCPPDPGVRQGLVRNPCCPSLPKLWNGEGFVQENQVPREPATCQAEAAEGLTWPFQSLSVPYCSVSQEHPGTCRSTALLGSQVGLSRGRGSNSRACPWQAHSLTGKRVVAHYPENMGKRLWYGESRKRSEAGGRAWEGTGA